MQRLVTVAKAGMWPENEATDKIVLNYDDRHRRRLRLTSKHGTGFLLDLAKPQPLDDGDGLCLEDGKTWLRVDAGDEDVLDIHTAEACDLIRMTWHLGNRHVPIQILNDNRLRVRFDSVIEEMVQKLGATTDHAMAPFIPENSLSPRQRGARQR